MRKMKLHIWWIFTVCLFNISLGQSNGKIEPKSVPDTSLTRPNQIQSTESNSFIDIQKNLIQIQELHTEEEAVEYYNLGELYTDKNQPELAKSYYLKSIDIFRKSLRANSNGAHDKGIANSTSKKVKTKRLNKGKRFNEYKAYLGLIKSSLSAQTPSDALKYTKEAESNYKNHLGFQLLKLDVYQANGMWQSILDLCDTIDKTKHTKEVDSILINKRTLAKAKLGVEDDLLIGYSNLIVMDDAVQTDHEEEILEDVDGIEEESKDVPVLDISSNLNTLSYETQDEIANTYGQNEQFDKELNIRESLSKSKVINEKQKAKQKLEIGKLYSKTSKKDQAISALEESLTLAKASKDISLQKETVLKLIDLYDEDKDSKKMVQYYKELQSLNEQEDSLQEENKKKELEEVTSLIDQKAVIKNIEESRNLYQKEQVLADQASSLTQSQLRFQKTVILCLILGLFIAVFVVIWYHKQRSRLKMVNLQLELKNMRNQMNPHFIFNSLNAVNHFIAQRNELLANEYLTEFALLMRNTLNQSDLDLIPLRDELTFLNRYCELEKMRFENKFDFTFTVDQNINIDAFQIPPLLLQPFVENAVWHGLRYLEHKGQLDVSFTQEKEKLKIEIVDNGIGREQSKLIKTSNQKKHQSKGVNLIKRRISISNQLTPMYIDWHIEDNQPQGTRVVLFLSKK